MSVNDRHKQQLDAGEDSQTPPVKAGFNRRAVWLASLLLAALFLLTLGFGAGRWVLSSTTGTPPVPVEDSPEVTFARNMIAHHEQAIRMALRLRDRTANEELRTLALDILLTQQAQLGQMQGWLLLWGLPLAGSKPAMAGHGQMMGMATFQQVEELGSLPLAQAEKSFMELMIRHHQGGVAMARQVLQLTGQPQIRRMASAIVSGQESEISYLKDLLAQRGNN